MSRSSLSLVPTPRPPDCTQLGPVLGPLLHVRVGSPLEILAPVRGRALDTAARLGWTFASLSLTAELIGWSGLVQIELLAPLAAYVLGIGPLLGWLARRRFAALPRLDSIRGAPVGGRVRIVGTVLPEAAAIGTDEEDARPVVFTQTVFIGADEKGRASTWAREEVRGVPFRVRLADGQSVRIAAEKTFLLDRPRRIDDPPVGKLLALGAALRGRFGLRRPGLYEAKLRAGDVVEAVGFLTSEIDVHGPPVLSRCVPMEATLVPDGPWIAVRRMVGTSGGPGGAPRRYASESTWASPVLPPL